MYISQLIIENFRVFGSGDDRLALPLQPGLTALVGENDTGKTAIIDALRFVLGTRGQGRYPRRFSKARVMPAVWFADDL